MVLRREDHRGEIGQCERKDEGAGIFGKDVDLGGYDRLFEIVLTSDNQQDTIHCHETSDMIDLVFSS